MKKIKLEDLLKLAERIKNVELREKTCDLLKNFSPSNKKMKYKVTKLEEAPAWIGAHHSYKGGLITHIYSVTLISIRIAEEVEKVYEKSINFDHLIAGALLHDLAKLFQLKKISGRYYFTNFMLDHAAWMASELYSREFPEEVINIILAHGGETIPPNPKSHESFILHHADQVDASLESSSEEVFFLRENV